MKKFIHILKYGILIVFLPIFIAIILQVFFFEMYKIPSTSMEPTLVPGDYVIVTKISYGARLFKIRKYLREGNIEYVRTKGWSPIKKGDVFVFNWPRLRTPEDAYGGFIVKRCYGLPGDSVVIKSKELNRESESLNLFPHDSTLKWTLKNYGPLYVPRKGDTLILSIKNVRYYKDVLGYEGVKTQTRNDSVFANKKYSKYYIFKYNYYFVKGDNFYGSQDSRYWGFVPETHIIGKAKFVLFSINPEESGLNKISWKRIFKSI